MSVSSFLARIGERRRQFKEMEAQNRMQQRLEEKQLSADEREYLRYQREERAKQVRSVVEKIRKKRNNELWHSKTALDAPMIFKRERTMLSEPTIFTREKRLFFYG